MSHFEELRESLPLFASLSFFSWKNVNHCVSENSWLYDLLYGKKPQYYEPQPVQYQPQEQYNEYNQFQEREQDYQDYQYQQQQPIQQQSQTPSTTTARTTTVSFLLIDSCEIFILTLIKGCFNTHLT